MAKFDQIRENIIKTTNLGDSGYLILRPDKNTPGKFKTIFKSASQQYSFNFPYQCGTAGDGSPEQKNLGQEALENEHEIQDYDIVVMASDGIWDNLFETNVKSCIKK
jgi:protein phosphatase PTC7